MATNHEIKHRNVFMVYFLSLITLGLYPIFWMFKTHRDMESLGADLPTPWLMFVPIVSLFYVYKYVEAYSHHVKKDESTMKWFCVFLFFGIVMPGFVQSSLNKYAAKHEDHDTALEAA